MTIAKQLFIANCILTASLTQAVSMEGFDKSTLNPYIIRAQEALNLIREQVQFEDHGEHDIMVVGKKYTKTLYPRQKLALNLILKKLKHTAENLKQGDKATWLTARQLYKAFKDDVYRNWKATFKHNYKKSLKNSTPFAWAWSITLSIPVIQEKQII